MKKMYFLALSCFLILLSACEQPSLDSGGFTVTFEKNSMEAEGTMTPVQIAAGTSQKLPPLGFTNNGLFFAGWALFPQGSAVYGDEGIFTMGTSNITLYAKWTMESHMVFFNSQGGSGIPGQIIADGGLAMLPISERNGYALVGWYTDPGCENIWDFNTDTVNRDMTLYASWTEATDLLEYTLININEYSVSKGYADTDGNVIVPEYWKTKKVTLIEDSAFQNCMNMTGISLPDTIVYIGENAFSHCTKINSLILPADLEFIEASAFSDCDSLEEIEIPEKVTSIKEYAFSNCIQLKSLSFPSGVTRIPYAVCSGCTNLAAVHIDGPVTSIYDYAFSGCNSLAEISLPDTVTSIRQYAFYLCSQLTDVVLPASLIHLYPCAFASCRSLTSMIVPPGVTEISYQVFNYCDSMEEISLPDGVTSIGEGAFEYCTSLETISIPDSVYQIGEDAFNYCSSLTELVLPASLTVVERGTFEHCTSLQSLVIPEGITTIGDISFRYCGEISELTIPSTVTTIGVNAFCALSKLTTVIAYPEEPPVAAFAMFYLCDELNEILVPPASVDDYKTADKWSYLSEIIASQ